MRASAEPFELARVSLARVARHEAWFTAQLHPHDRSRASTLLVVKRRIDFIAGRFAARRALRAIECDAPLEVEVGAREGAPSVHGGFVSISHGAGWAVAAATRACRIGIDIERVEPRHPALLVEAFAPGELDAWRAFTHERGDALVTLAWCAKEAWLKVRGDGLRAVLTELAITPRALRDGVVVADAGETSLHLHLHRRADVQLAIALPT